MSNSTLIPQQYTTAEKNALTNIQNGSLIIDTDLNQLQTTYDFGSTWINISSGGDNAYASMTITGNGVPSGTATTISSPGVPVKIEGPYNSNSLLNFTFSNGELTYTGTNTAKFKVTVDISAEMDLDSDVIAVYIYKDSTQIDISEQKTFVGPTSPVPQNVGLQALVDLEPGEKISIFVSNETDNDDITISNLSCIVEAKSIVSSITPVADKLYGGWKKSLSGIATSNPGINVYTPIVMQSYPSLPSNGFTNASGIITYTGSETLYFRVSYDISFAITFGSGSSSDYLFTLFKNGVELDPNQFGIFIGAQTKYQSVNEEVIIELKTNDTLQLRALNNTSSVVTITCYSAGIVITEASN